jgi:hypothetical protein
MRYLDKTDKSKVLSSGWQYPQHAARIREELLREQQSYCAYSERHITNTDSCDVEHFDPRLKNTAEDSYWNWYAVLHWMNSHKPRLIDPYLPILAPWDTSRPQRIRYEDGQFVTARDDQEAANLVRYLGWNRPELARDRANHIARIRDLRGFFQSDEGAFLQYLRDHPDCLSFVTALEAELGIGLTGQ